MSCSDCENCAMDSKEVIYQVHVTVLPDFSFLRTCGVLGIKGVHVRNLIGDEEVDDMMTSTIAKSLPEAINKMMKEKDCLSEYFKVVRCKIETVPWNPIATKANRGQYFETHLNMGKNDEVYDKVKSNPNFMVSRNQNGSIYLTVRTRDTRGNHWAELCKRTATLDIPFVKAITEFVYYDSNEEHDKDWEYQ